MWNEGRDIPIEGFDPRRDYPTIVSDVESVIKKKMSKSYPADTVLVVDIHHDMFGAFDYPIERQLVKTARLALGRFKEVWLRKGQSLLRASPVSISRVSQPWPSDED